MKDPAFAAAFRDAQARSTLVRELLRRRLDVGLTQADVAARLRVKVREVRAFEGGATDPYLSFLYRYARAVGSHLSVGLLIRPTGEPR